MCVDFIYEVGLFISSLQTKEINASGGKNDKPGFERYLKIAGSYVVFDRGFRIYRKGSVLSDVLSIIVDFCR